MPEKASGLQGDKGITTQELKVHTKPVRFNSINNQEKPVEFFKMGCKTEAASVSLATNINMILTSGLHERFQLEMSCGSARANTMIR